MKNFLLATALTMGTLFSANAVENNLDSRCEWVYEYTHSSWSYNSVTGIGLETKHYTRIRRCSTTSVGVAVQSIAIE